MSDMVYIPNINVQKEGIDILNHRRKLSFYCDQQSTNSQPYSGPTVYQLSINNWLTDVDTMHTMGMNCHESTYIYISLLFGYLVFIVFSDLIWCLWCINYL